MRDKIFLWAVDLKFPLNWMKAIQENYYGVKLVNILRQDPVCLRCYANLSATEF